MGNINPVHDWNKMKMEWLESDLTINKFRETKEINNGYFYTNIDVDDWYKAKHELDKKTLNKLTNKLSTEIANKYSDYNKLWKAVKIQAASIIKKTQKKDGTISPMSTYDLNNLSRVIETALRSERLIQGDSTENQKVEFDVISYVQGRMREKD